MCYACVIDGQTKRHANPRFDNYPKPPTPSREHGTFKGCRQHWSRGEPLCTECTHFHDNLDPDRTRTMNIRIPQVTFNLLRDRAELRGTTVSDLVRLAITDFLLDGLV